MIPKLALNFVVDSKEVKAEDLLPIFDNMKASGIGYIEAIITNITTLEELKPYAAAFKKFRMYRHVDYSIWVNDGAAGKDTMIAILTEIKKTEKLVMGASSLDHEYDNVPFIKHIENGALSWADLRNMSDREALKHSLANIDDINAPEGMIRGLKRVLDDHVKLLPIDDDVSDSPVEE